MSLMMQVWPAAVRASMKWRICKDRRRRAGRQQICLGLSLLRREGAQGRYDIEMNEVKPYLQLEKLRGMFWATGQLYGFAFTQGGLVANMTCASGK